MGIRKTHQRFLDQAMMIHGNRYDYSLVEYKGSRNPVIIICSIHGRFLQNPCYHVAGSGCPTCGTASRTMTVMDFVSRVKLIHGNKYDYSRIDRIVTRKTPVAILCNQHGEFLQQPNNHLLGRGCPVCAANTRKNALLVGVEEFICRSVKIHGNRYDYSSVVYTNAHDKVSIRCSHHGIFMQEPNSHSRGAGCPSCGFDKSKYSRTRTLNEFITEARAVHGDRYQYIEYVGCHDKINIQCPKHGDFFQTPTSHIHGRSGCPLCSSVISICATQWLDTLGLPRGTSYREVCGLIPKRGYKVDGFDPVANTVYEFHGDYWHGNPIIYSPDQVNYSCQTTFGQLYADTIERRRVFLSHGYNWVEIWESDWLTRQQKDNEYYV